jgi:hypothetical protein
MNSKKIGMENGLKIGNRSIPNRCFTGDARIVNKDVNSVRVLANGINCGGNRFVRSDIALNDSEAVREIVVSRTGDFEPLRK